MRPRVALGCLLGLELRRVGTGRRLTFTAQGEVKLSAWMAERAKVSWVEHPQPWLLESALISDLDDQNKHNDFHTKLRAIRAAARDRARELPIST